jgi:hypothetical protein
MQPHRHPPEVLTALATLRSAVDRLEYEAAWAVAYAALDSVETILTVAAAAEPRLEEAV